MNVGKLKDILEVYPNDMEIKVRTAPCECIEVTRLKGARYLGKGKKTSEPIVLIVTEYEKVNINKE